MYTKEEIKNGQGLFTSGERTTIGRSLSEPKKYFTCGSGEYFGSDIEIVGYGWISKKGIKINWIE